MKIFENGQIHLISIPVHSLMEIIDIYRRNKLVDSIKVCKKGFFAGPFSVIFAILDTKLPILPKQ